MQTHSKIVDVISSLFVMLFVYTALSKWLDFASFQAVLSQIPLFGHFSIVVAWFLPVLEIWMAALLFLPSTRRLGLYASVALMFVFTAYLIYMLLYASELPCSCGGVLRYLSWRSHLLFNIGWIMIGSIAIKLDVSQGVSRKPV